MSTPLVFKHVSLKTIIDDKKLTKDELIKNLNKVKEYDACENKRCFAGNKFLYHFQLENLCKVKVNGKPSLEDIIEDENLYKTLWKNMVAYNRSGNIPTRLFEAWRLNGAVSFFKSTTSKYIYKITKATKVLDPTAGWGGRMIGAWALDISYTGIDTNIDMKPAYNDMMTYINAPNINMIWEDCLKTDFSKIDYDCVLTSPPYINLEMYKHMPLFDTDHAYYTTWLIPLLDKCLLHIKKGGHVCFNISPKMYHALTVYHKYKLCDFEINMLQQKRLGIDKQDKTYCWIKI
jgi:hypothetical protein